MFKSLTSSIGLLFFITSKHLTTGLLDEFLVPAINAISNQSKNTELNIDETQEEDPSSFDLNERSVEAISLSSWMTEMLNLINTERQNAGASPLCFNEKLIAAAQDHTTDMVNNDIFSHTGSDGSSLSTRVNQENYAWNYIAENIAINTSVPGAHSSLMGSPGHRANILNSQLTQIGLARATQTSGKWSNYQYYTQVFARSNSELCSVSNVVNEVNEEVDETVVDSDDSSCNDSPSGWYDSGGSTYDCSWYASGPGRCTLYGNGYEKFGKTANEACCVCGGGSSEEKPPSSSCANSPSDWFDSGGITYDCAWYALDERYCEVYGDSYRNFGKTAKEACCVCGGGSD